VPQQGFHCIVDLEDVSFESCIECAATRGRCQLTASLLRGMADQARSRNAEDQGRADAARARHDAARARDAEKRSTLLVHLPMLGDSGSDLRDPDDIEVLANDPTAIPIPPLSVTALTGCVRQAYLKATEPFYQRPDQQYWAYRGTLAHLLAEQGAGPDIVAERRFERELRLPSGRVITITGRPDEIDPTRGLLIDYKTTDRAPRQPSPLHIAQLNAYRWLVAPEYQIDRLGIVYLTMKGVQKASAPVWPDGQVERLLQERAGALAEAYSGGDWPELTEDRWMCSYCPVAAACERGPAGQATAAHLAAS
jgi:CRISPR/Cas system-associated exonuclease Cas4 (RecB family)